MRAAVLAGAVWLLGLFATVEAAETTPVESGPGEAAAEGQEKAQDLDRGGDDGSKSADAAERDREARERAEEVIRELDRELQEELKKAPAP